MERVGIAVMARFKFQNSNLATGGVKPKNTSVKTAQFKACGLLNKEQGNYQFGHVFHQNLALVGLWETAIS